MPFWGQHSALRGSKPQRIQRLQTTPLTLTSKAKSAALRHVYAVLLAMTHLRLELGQPECGLAAQSSGGNTLRTGATGNKGLKDEHLCCDMRSSRYISACCTVEGGDLRRHGSIQDFCILPQNPCRAVPVDIVAPMAAFIGLKKLTKKCHNDTYSCSLACCRYLLP